MKAKRLLATLLIFAMAAGILPGTLTKSKAATEEKQYVICLDPGHQARANTGQEAIGPGSSETKYKVTGGCSGCVTHVSEYSFVLKIAKKLKKELKARGYKVIMTRTKNNVNISNQERTMIANNAKADALLHIHCDSIDSSSVHGAETLAPASNNPYMSKSLRKKSQKFAKKLINKYCSVTGANNRGVYKVNNMTGINWSKVPVATIEMGFMSNPTEDRKMQTKAYQKKMVKGIADGFDAYFKK